MQNPQINELQVKFNQLDRDRSGRLSSRELTSISFGTHRFTIDTANILLRAFDTDYSGQIEFQEFAAMNQFVNKMSAQFMAADRDRSGKLNVNEIATALTSEGLQMPPQTIEKIIRKYDRSWNTNPSRAGLTFEAFIKVAAHLLHLKAVFQRSDPSNTGRITISLQQLVDMTVEV
jgi:Ca2+-binding EF-hand superfamily protein